MEFSKKQIEHIANLARLKLTEKEKRKFQKELSLILDWVDKLKEVDIKDVEPMGQVTGLENVIRKDKVKPSNTKEQILKNAPMRKGDYIKTKKPL